MSESEIFQGSIFKFIGEILKRHSVRKLLVGGYALNAYKIQRMTFDIDFMLTSDEYSRIEEDLKGSGYSVLNQSNAFIQLQSDLPGLRDLDFLLCDEPTISSLIENGNVVQIAGEDFIIPSPIHLIAMKLHAISSNKDREMKDFQDIIQIIRVCKIDPSSNELKSFFKKYDLLSLYEKTIKILE